MDLQGCYWDGHGLRVPAATAIKLAKRELSATAITGLENCPARWAVSYLAPKAKDPFSPTALGLAWHTALEAFHGLTPEQKAEIGPTWATWFQNNIRTQTMAGFVPVDRIDEWMADVGQVGAGYLSGNVENPLDVTAVDREVELHATLDGIPFRGSIDRVTLIQGNQVFIDDYKTSKQHNPTYERQIRLYRMAFESLPDWQGYQAAGGRLLYLRTGAVEPVLFTDASDQTALADLRTASTTLAECGQAGEFPTKPSGLCPWCPASGSCPAFQTALAEKTIHLKDTAPVHTVEELPIPVHTVKNQSRQIGPQPVPFCPDSGKPWDEYSPHGEPNPSSYAAIAVADVVSYADYLLWEGGYDPSSAMVATMADILTVIIGRVQNSITGQGLDWQVGSNSRARWLLKEVLKKKRFAPPWESQKNDTAWATWANQVTDAAITFWRISYPILTRDNTRPIPMPFSTLTALLENRERVVRPTLESLTTPAEKIDQPVSSAL